ncbi:hypothetical protein DL95DRAFT_383479 [Leptodontidium sp. 2 PMI_412]|nr:hypothetical protein DL95DRAFT_383479 [Leptodontidium sp. 2 PMI_412]
MGGGMGLWSAHFLLPFFFRGGVLRGLRGLRGRWTLLLLFGGRCIVLVKGVAFVGGRFCLSLGNHFGRRQRGFLVVVR